ncbi:MAG TPA: ATP-dependent DNA helicase [Vicinamibacterales bacterium]|nr:ATP-dependent DNA helicase [Vicinamibacterales bacterium]
MPQVPAVPGGLNTGAERRRLIEAVDRIFAPGGPLSEALGGFESRPAQRQMAAAVADTISSGGVLLAEAGTGTGKTLAYLVPAILSRQRVLVSTGTKNLQEQIYFKDLPLLRETLDVKFSATYMKGRNNYLCLHRFDAIREGHAFRTVDEKFALDTIEEWAHETQTGDRAEMEDLPEDLSFWPDIAATAENCIGKDCPRFDDCFVTKMRQRAAEADVVIVNHHLLCADAAVRQNANGEVIPACRYAIVDEAHQLEDVATQYFGIALSTYRVEDFVGDAERAVRAKQIPDPSKADAFQTDAERVRIAARTFFATLQMLRFDAGPSSVNDNRVRVRRRHLQAADEETAALAAALEALEATIVLTKDIPEDVLALGRRAAELRKDLTFLTAADDAAYVYFLEIRGRSGVFLRASPIDVSDIIRELLLERMHATVLTSATLSVDASFDYVRGRLGIDDASEIRLPSEFDFSTQTILYLPRRMPDPRSPAFVEAAAAEVIEILKRTRGRAFVLFTSYANLRRVHQLASIQLEYPVLLQGSAPRSALLREFKATPNAVLFATSSFWQGVDVVGEALSCVIIDKLPFASPGDPVTAARIEAINAAGGNAFADYQIPLAILVLLQGLGRLIRHRQDRGVLAVLDPRLRTMGYGRRFLQSLPPAPITHDVNALDRFFADA